jgi:hypothetical protein
MFNDKIFVKTKITNFEGGWVLEFIFWFIETTHERLELDKWGLVQ